MTLTSSNVTFHDLFLAFGATFPEEMWVSGPKSRWNSLRLQVKRVISKTVAVLKYISTLLRFCKWSFSSTAIAKTASEMIQKVDFPLET